jgi:hypothetical protein
MRMSSPVEDALRAAKSAEPKQTVQIRVAGLLEKYPNDFSVQVIAALAALADSRADEFAEAAARLKKLTEESPLEALPEGARANSRQRNEAARWLGLWLVARECLKSPAQREVALKLADRSLEAARRQSDRKYALCMLREWGQIELAAQDKESADARWSAMVALVLPPAGKSKADSRTLSVPTLAQFNHAADVAKLAGENGMSELSLRTVRESLKAGPPINVTPTAGGFGMAPGMGGAPGGAVSTRSVRVGTQTRQNDMSPVITQVENRLSDLVRVWTSKDVPLADQYETLAAVVFPYGRPAEVFLYPTAAKAAGNSASIGKLLVTIAVKAGRIDDLAARIAAREKQPLSQPAAQELQSLLELERQAE